MSPRFAVFIGALVAVIALPAAALAQGDGPRMYWKTLTDANALTFSPMHITSNTNPLDPAHVQSPDGSFEANIALAGYSRTLDLFGRSAVASLLLPVGNLQGEVSGVPLDQQDTATGFGDPMLNLDLNLIGAPAMNDLPSLQRYEPKFTLDVLASLAVPVGEYDGDQALNIGQNRWYGRVGAPLMLTLGPWVPGQRTTIEVLPAVWMFAENSDYLGGTLSTDPILQLEAHLTHDFTRTAWGSLDVAGYTGSGSEVNGVPVGSLDNVGVGFTVGFQVTSNLSISASYFTTVNDGDPGDIRGDEFRLNITYGWHALLEGMDRLMGSE